MAYLADPPLFVHFSKLISTPACCVHLSSDVPAATFPPGCDPLPDNLYVKEYTHRGSVFVFFAITHANEGECLLTVPGAGSVQLGALGRLVFWAPDATAATTQEAILQLGSISSKLASPFSP